MERLREYVLEELNGFTQARRNEIDIGGAVNKANCTGLRENFCSATPFRLLESNLAIQIAIFNG